MDTEKKLIQTSGGLFTRHPRSIGETYSQHLRYAFKCGFKLAIAGICCMIHSVFPFLFESTASKVVKEITHEFDERKK